MKNEIILYDDHSLYLECLRSFLDHLPSYENYVITGATDFDHIGKMLSHKTEILIMNIAELNYNHVLEDVENLRLQHPELKIMVLSPRTEVTVIKKFFDRGVKCFLTKDTDSTEFVKALNHVLQGKIYINEEAQNSLLNYICSVEDTPVKKFRSEELSEREKEVLRLICDGWRTKEIADKLFISKHTVESHRRNIMLKLEVRNASMLVKFAMDHRLVT